MRKEYDFSKGKKGIFYSKDKRKAQYPIYLDATVEKHFSEIAKIKGKDISTIINNFLKKELEIHKDLTI